MCRAKNRLAERMRGWRGTLSRVCMCCSTAESASTNRGRKSARPIQACVHDKGKKSPFFVRPPGGEKIRARKRFSPSSHSFARLPDITCSHLIASSDRSVRTRVITVHDTLSTRKTAAPGRRTREPLDTRPPIARSEHGPLHAGHSPLTTGAQAWLSSQPRQRPLSMTIVSLYLSRINCPIM